jgi:hypothetical protein
MAQFGRLLLLALMLPLLGCPRVPTPSRPLRGSEGTGGDVHASSPQPIPAQIVAAP